jgi:hypothetical protein
MNTNNKVNPTIQGYGPSLQGYSDPNSNNNPTNNNAVNSSKFIPGTYVPNGHSNENYQLYTPPSTQRVPNPQPILCQVITGGNDGPLYVDPTYPDHAYNNSLVEYAQHAAKEFFY